MSRILVFAGNAQSGKSTAAKFVSGTMLKQAKVVDWFEVHDESGDLWITAKSIDKDNNIKPAVCKLDLYRQDAEYTRYASERIWPHAKIYSYANCLKLSLSEIFGLNSEYFYGSNEDKNRPTHIKYDVIKKLLPKHKLEKKGEFITYRQSAQVFGEVCRILDPDCWVSRAVADIMLEQYQNVMIDDCRYENEVKIMKEAGAKIVLLTRDPLKMDHDSEKILELDRSNFDYIIENEGNISIKEKERQIYDILLKEGWITSSV